MHKHLKLMQVPDFKVSLLLILGKTILNFRFIVLKLTLKSWSINCINFNRLTINFGEMFCRLKQLNCHPYVKTFSLYKTLNFFTP